MTYGQMQNVQMEVYFILKEHIYWLPLKKYMRHKAKDIMQN